MTRARKGMDAPVAVSVEAGAVRVAPEGALDTESIGAVRDTLERRLPARLSGPLSLDLSKVTHLDASGVSVAVFLFRLAKGAGVGFEVTGADADRRLLVDLALRGQEPQAPPKPIGFAREVGVASLAIKDGVLDLVRFIGEIAIVFAKVVANPRHLRVEIGRAHV